MKSRFSILCLLVNILLISCEQAPQYYEVSGRLHTPYHIKFEHTKPLDKEIDEQLKYFYHLFNAFDSTSVISQVNQNRDIRVDTLFQKVFKKALEVSAETNGAYDVTCAPLINLWGFGFSRKDSVTPAHIDSVRQFIGFQKVRLEGDRIVKDDPRLMMNFSSLADGTVCDMIAQMLEKKGIATEKGELNRGIQKANRLIREIRAQIGKLKEWIADLFKARETAPEQPPQSPNLANLLMKYLSVQREKSRKYSQRWQQQHTADELKTIAAAVNYLSEHGISNLDELDASLSSVSDKAYSIREGMKTAEQCMKELQKLIENGENYLQYKPIHAELKKLKNGWTNKRDKYEEAHRAELTLWNAASRYLHANLTDIKTLPISKWKQEYADLKEQRDTDYTKLKATRAEVAELQKIRKCVDIALRADQPEQTQNRAKRHEQER